MKSHKIPLQISLTILLLIWSVLCHDHDVQPHLVNKTPTELSSKLTNWFESWPTVFPHFLHKNRTINTSTTIFFRHSRKVSVPTLLLHRIQSANVVINAMANFLCSVFVFFIDVFRNTWSSPPSLVRWINLCDTKHHRFLWFGAHKMFIRVWGDQLIFNCYVTDTHFSHIWFNYDTIYLHYMVPPWVWSGSSI